MITQVAIWNLLDYPALVIPITKVDPRTDIKRTRSEFFGEFDRRVYEFCTCPRLSWPRISAEIT